MKKILFISTSIFILLIFSFKPFKSVTADKNYNDCIEKYKSDWGTVCPRCVNYKEGYKRDYDDTYKVYLRNTCDEKVEIMCCVQEEDKTWNCTKVTALAPQDTMIAWACKGVGKYKFWTRKNGDSSIQFPSKKDIDEKYSE